MSMTIYQWPPGTGTESIFPRCVVFNRICKIANQKPLIVNVGVPDVNEDFLTTLQTRLSKLPLLEFEGKKYRSSRQIIEFFLNHEENKVIRSRLLKLHSSFSFITQQWANEIFINTLVYARWKREVNYMNFVKNVSWGEPFPMVEERVNRIREEVLKYLKRTTVGELKDEEYLELLRNQLWPLEQILENQEYLEPSATYPTLTDLNVFMVVQGLLSPDLDESKMIKKNYPNIYEWFMTVDAVTLRPTT